MLAPASIPSHRLQVPTALDLTCSLHLQVFLFADCICKPDLCTHISCFYNYNYSIIADVTFQFGLFFLLPQVLLITVCMCCLLNEPSSICEISKYNCLNIMNIRFFIYCMFPTFFASFSVYNSQKNFDSLLTFSIVMIYIFLIIQLQFCTGYQSFQG